ncbi:MAG: 16S rRNA (adenine(1518)-N(6)/adenine(1519)-N(6))-dimethyltransferase RsmA, partial [Candidatus Kapabacteria bacterium]|nr:16S rRNA (adenine(1518)-N(6)/adenine(1519)-N(6))-dimethyltransferase RsmA [Candidatus Kapabacteria bacterium]MDW7996986.1 16S rRNA (adenine(1518)-N(6)/adenine(1519)-N(6))-dimethyltransferase RsmA [Bacteroidota bacterium]
MLRSSPTLWKTCTNSFEPNSTGSSSGTITPRKRWGQHFLRNARLAHQIVELLECCPGDTVIEIGPGTGALTEHLAALPIRLVAVEVDPQCIAILQKRFPISDYAHIELVRSDVLEYDLLSLARQTLEKTGRKLRVIGNLPYNISSPLLFRLFEIAPLLSKAVLMLQREVAQRLIARPCTKSYGILRIACWVVAEAQLHFHVPATAFVPSPTIVSSVMSLRFRPDAWTGTTFTGFVKLLHAAFGQRRKKLRNAL